MTCIIGLEHDGVVSLCADTFAGNVHTKMQTGQSKIAQFTTRKSSIPGDVIVGFAGSFRIIDLVRYHLEVDKLPKIKKTTDLHQWVVVNFIPALAKVLKVGGSLKTHSGKSEGGTMLLGVRDRLFLIQDDMSVVCSNDPYMAIGAGEVHATGAIAALHDHTDEDYVTILKSSMAVVAANNPFVSGIAHVVTTGTDYAVK